MQRKASKLSRRGLLVAAASGLVVPAVPRPALALPFPNRPVRLLVGFSAGGPLDVGARLIAQSLSERLGQSFVVENRPGASGNIATETVVRAPPDGYTLLACAAPNAFNEALYDHLSFDFVRDIAPVAAIARYGGVMEISPAVPWKTVSDIIAYAKANPGKINMASAGLGSTPGIWGELFINMTGLDITIVQYPGSAPALIDLIGGRVQLMFDPALTAVPAIKAGKVRGIAVTTAEGMPQLPNLPPLARFVPGYQATTWQGIGAPRNTPQEIIAILNRAVNAALAEPKFKATLAQMGAESFATSPTEFAGFIKQYSKKWTGVIRSAGLKAQ